MLCFREAPSLCASILLKILYLGNSVETDIWFYDISRPNIQVMILRTTSFSSTNLSRPLVSSLNYRVVTKELFRSALLLVVTEWSDVTHSKRPDSTRASAAVSSAI
jgi:hypothetical protein